MELLHEFLVTASLAVFLSFIVARLVSLALASDCGHVGVMPTVDVTLVETQLKENKVLGSFSSEEVVAEAESTHDDEHPEVVGEVGCDTLVGTMVGSDDSERKTGGFVGSPLSISEDGVAEVSQIDKRLVKQSGDAGTSSDGDDDWEGVERTDLEKIFTDALKFMETEAGTVMLQNVKTESLVQLYALQKISMEGPCREPKPLPLRVSARAKWDAWQNLGNMPPEDAMEEYLRTLSENLPGWNNGKSSVVLASSVASNDGAFHRMGCQ